MTRGSRWSPARPGYDRVKGHLDALLTQDSGIVITSPIYTKGIYRPLRSGPSSNPTAHLLPGRRRRLSCPDHGASMVSQDSELLFLLRSLIETGTSE